MMNLKAAIATDLPGLKITDDCIDELNYSGNELRTVKFNLKMVDRQKQLITKMARLRLCKAKYLYTILSHLIKSTMIYSYTFS